MVRLIALSMVRNEEFWIWYSLTSVYPHVDRILLFDNHSDDRTLEIVRGMAHVRDKLTVFEGFGGASEHDNREQTLAAARDAGGTHVLFLDGDEVHADPDLGFCRRLLELHEHRPTLADPPRNHQRAGDCSVTDGVLVKNIGFKPVHPGWDWLGSCIAGDLVKPDTDHSCYNFAIRIAGLDNLRGNGLEWGQHGFVESEGIYIQSSPRTLWLPGVHYFHFTVHERSTRRDGSAYGRPPQDLGSAPLPRGVNIPEVLHRRDGPPNPTLHRWGLKVMPGMARGRVAQAAAGR